MKNKETIYIVLTDTGTWLSRAIGWYTGKSLNHASIAFDKNLNEMYSFGRKVPTNPFIGGFVREDLMGRLFLNEQRETGCEIYRCELSARNVRRIKSFIKHVERQGDRMKYNMLGLFGVALGVQWNRGYAYFCSQFVASAFKAGGVSLVDKPPCLTTPQDLAESVHVHMVYTGTINDYFRLIEGSSRAHLCYNRMESIS